MGNERTPDVVTVAVTRADGGLTILRVITTEYRPTTDVEKASGLGNRIANWTIEPTQEYIERIIAKHNWPPELQAVSWRIVPNDIVDESTDRTFRNAWKDEGGRKPGVDMVKARDLHRDRLRNARTPLLEALDVEYMLADEKNNNQEKARIASRKQILRDVTKHPDIESAQTPEELKKVWPL